MYPDDPTRALLAEDAARRRLCRRAVRPARDDDQPAPLIEQRLCRGALVCAAGDELHLVVAQLYHVGTGQERADRRPVVGRPIGQAESDRLRKREGRPLGRPVGHSSGRVPGQVRPQPRWSTAT